MHKRKLHSKHISIKKNIKSLLRTRALNFKIIENSNYWNEK